MTTSETIDSAFEQAAKLLEDGSRYAAVECIESAGGPGAVMNRYVKIATELLYWQRKAIDAFVFVSQAGIHFGLLRGRDAADAKTTHMLRSAAKGMAYNLASFTWPGWDEPGIVLGPHHLAAGLDAARLNLSLANELDKPPLAVSNAHWVLASQHLAAGAFDAALAQFQCGKQLADTAAGQAAEEQQAEAAAQALMTQGYVYVTMLIRGDDDAARRGLGEVTRQLKPLPSGAFFVEQLETALRMFGGSARNAN